MFRFSIRDLLWLTLVVALALGWPVHERQLRHQLANASKWRGAAGALEHVLIDDGLQVSWKMDATKVEVTLPNAMSDAGRWRDFKRTISIDNYEPSDVE